MTDVYAEFPDGGTPVTDDPGVQGVARGDADVERVRTGDERVDAVLASLDGLDDRPVGEHAGVFEQAHEQLRAALEPDRESA